MDPNHHKSSPKMLWWSPPVDWDPEELTQRFTPPKEEAPPPPREDDDKDQGLSKNNGQELSKDDDEDQGLFVNTDEG